MRHFHRFALIAAASLPTSLWAATDTTTFDVTATVVNACDVSASNLAFGNYDPISVVATDATTTINVTCTLGATYSLRLNAGLNGAGVVTDRAMSNGVNSLAYDLYTDALRTDIWGNDGATGVNGTGTGLSVPTIVYGRIPAGQTVGAASFTDTITVTLEF